MPGPVRGPRPAHPGTPVATPASRPLRRSLSHVGGAVDVEGDEEPAAILARALDFGSSPAPDIARRGARDDDEDRAHVHGFHSYPARMHPGTARILVEGLSEPGQVVLDPFAGSGTVLAEALGVGRAAVGVDLNPLATMLAWSKLRPRHSRDLQGLADAANGIRGLADERRRDKSGASRRYGAEDMSMFDAHVLFELDSLKLGIDRVGNRELRADLALVLSSILVKVSRKKADTSEAKETTRIAAGYTAKLFVKKAEEYRRRLETFAAGLPRPRPRVDVFTGDATKLADVRTASVDLVVTSPPYVATYDYIAHHALRLRRLGPTTRSSRAPSSVPGARTPRSMARRPPPSGSTNSVDS
ncbi:MAG: DNA methyltransferase [Polyangiaceae bacterium]